MTLRNGENKLPKALSRLGSLVGHEVEVRLRSNPETMLCGILDSFWFDVEKQVRLLVVDNYKTYRIVNWDDISLIVEKVLQNE